MNDKQAFVNLILRYPEICDSLLERWRPQVKQPVQTNQENPKS